MLSKKRWSTSASSSPCKMSCPGPPGWPPGLLAALVARLGGATGRTTAARRAARRHLPPRPGLEAPLLRTALRRLVGPRRRDEHCPVVIRHHPVAREHRNAAAAD